MAEPTNKTEPRKDRKLPSLKLQKLLAAIEKRITKSEADDTPQEQRLNAKELIGLTNAATGLSRVLRELDKETAEQGRGSKKAGTTKGVDWP
jgi:hypothetical protein